MRGKCRTDEAFCGGECIPRLGFCDIASSSCEVIDFSQEQNYSICAGSNCSGEDFICTNGKCIPGTYLWYYIRNQKYLILNLNNVIAKMYLNQKVIMKTIAGI